MALKLLWPVISFTPHWCYQYLCCWNANIDFYIPSIPLNQTFNPLSSQESLNCMTLWSFLFTHPRGVSTVWCWASNGQFTLCGASSVSLPFRVCSSGVVLVHLAHIVCTIAETGVLSVIVMRKFNFGGGLMSILSTGSSQGRKGCLLQPVIHFVCFLFPPVLHFPPPHLGISFSQHQVTWFPWNGISFSIIVPLLSLHLWHGLHLSLFKGFPQSFM